MKTKMKKVLSLFLVAVLVVPMLASLPAKKAEAADEVMPESYTVFTYGDLGFFDGTYDLSDTKGTAAIDQNMENGVVVAGYLKFENNSASRLCFGAGIDNNGFKLFSGDGKLIIQNMGGTFFWYEFSSDVAGVPVIGEYVDLKLSFQKVDHNGGGTKNDLKLGVWFADKLYNNEYIYIDDYAFIDAVAPTISFHKQGAYSEEAPNGGITLSSTAPVPPAPSVEEIPESYTVFTYGDLGFFDGTYDLSDTKGTAAIDQNMENGVVVAGYLKFENNSASRLCFGAGIDNNGFKLYSGEDKLIIQNMLGSFLWYEFTEEGAGVPIIGEYVDLKLSFQKVDHNGGGTKNDLKLGVWFADKLYNNEYIYIDDYAFIDAVAPTISFHKQGAYDEARPNGGITLSSSAPAVDEVIPESYTQLTFADLGFFDGSYEISDVKDTPAIDANLEDGVVVAGQMKFGNDSASRLCFGAGIDNNGIKVYGGGNELVIQNMGGDPFITTFKSSVVGYPVTNEYVDLKLSFQKVDHDNGGTANDLKIGVWFADKLYNNEYYYRDNYPFIDSFAPTLSIHRQEGHEPIAIRSAVNVAYYEDIAEYRAELKAPEAPKGYVFAGWYEEETLENAISVDTVDGAAYAKFVDADLLTVKAQVAAETDNSAADIRFITSVDGLEYRKIGFDITVGDDTITVGNQTVYRSLTVTLKGGATFTESPQNVFGIPAQYFKACVIEGIPAADFDTEITVKPYWITLDGTKVYGTEATKSVSQGL